MTSSIDLKKLFNSRGPEGLSRLEKQQLAHYNRSQFLFDKYLNQKKNKETLQLTHEHILEIGEVTAKRFETFHKRSSASHSEYTIKKEIERIEKEFEQYKQDLIQKFQSQLEEEKLSIKKKNEALLERIEKQRDQAEEENMKELIHRMNQECDEALRKQWRDAEEIKRKALIELREEIRKEIYELFEQDKLKAIREALEAAEEAICRRERAKFEESKIQLEKEWNEQMKSTCQRYDASIETLLQKLKESEEKLKNEKAQRWKLETDFRLLQTDYKRFMNYTDHYNSDYMMKLRHIGAQIIEDKEFEQKLNERIQLLNSLKTSTTKPTIANHHNESTKKSKVLMITAKKSSLNKTTNTNSNSINTS